jgi:hypothetical protein
MTPAVALPEVGQNHKYPPELSAETVYIATRVTLEYK